MFRWQILSLLPLCHLFTLSFGQLSGIGDNLRCDDIDCENGGTCDEFKPAGERYFTCTCRTSYYGNFCENRDGTWSSWGAYGGCSVSCGQGTMTRTRQCNNQEGSGLSCVGNSQENEECKVAVEGVVCLCSNPPPITGAVPNVSRADDVYGVGTAVEYYCEDGYSLSNSITAVECVEGNWPEPYPTCTIIRSESDSVSSSSSWLQDSENRIYLAVIAAAVLLGIITIVVLAYCCHQQKARRKKDAAKMSKKKHNNQSNQKPSQDRGAYLPSPSMKTPENPFGRQSTANNELEVSELDTDEAWKYYK